MLGSFSLLGFFVKYKYTCFDVSETLTIRSVIFGILIALFDT